MEENKRVIPDYVRGQIYCIICKNNPKVYVGQTKTHQWRTNANNWVPYGYKQRYAQHIVNSKTETSSKKCRALYAAMNMYKVENFEVILLEECSIDELDNAEIKHIKEKNTLAPNGYNLESGGNKNKFASADTRAKQSESRKKYIQTEEGKLSVIKRGKELQKFNISNNDKKKVDRYKTQIVDRIRVTFCDADKVLYVYIYCNGQKKRNKIRFKCPAVDDTIKNRCTAVVNELRQPNTKVEIDNNVI